MSKAKQRDVIQKSLDELDKIIESGDINKMLDYVNTLMASGVTPLPRQIAKISAHIYKVNDANLATEFGVEYGGFGAFTEQLSEVVLRDGTAEDNFDFALYVPNADRLAHGKAIRKKRSKMWWLAFAKMWPNIATRVIESTAKTKDNAQEAAQQR